LKVVKQSAATYVPVFAPHKETGDYRDFIYSNLRGVQWESVDEGDWIVNCSDKPFWQVNLSSVPSQFLNLFLPHNQHGLLQCTRTTTGRAKFRHVKGTELYPNYHPMLRSPENSPKFRERSEIVEWKLTLDFCGPNAYFGDLAFDIASNQIFDMKLSGFPVIYGSAKHNSENPPNSCCISKQKFKICP